MGRTGAHVVLALVVGPSIIDHAHIHTGSATTFPNLSRGLKLVFYSKKKLSLVSSRAWFYRQLPDVGRFFSVDRVVHDMTCNQVVPCPLPG